MLGHGVNIISEVIEDTDFIFGSVFTVFGHEKPSSDKFGKCSVEVILI